MAEIFQVDSASFQVMDVTGSFRTSLNTLVDLSIASVTGSFSASYILVGSNTTSSWANTSSWAINTVNGGSGTTLFTGSTYPITSSWAVTSSYALTPVTASWAVTSSFSLNSAGGSGTTLFTGSTYPITASWAQTASVTITQSISLTVTSASWASQSLSASYASFLNGSHTGSTFGTASWSNNSITSIAATSASWATTSLSASYSITSSFLSIPTFQTLYTLGIGSFNTQSVALLPASASALMPYVVNNKIYLFGGRQGGLRRTLIWTGSVDSPLLIRDSGKTLPRSCSYSSIFDVNGTIYMIGGGLSNKIMTASVSDPTTWGDSNGNFPIQIDGASPLVFSNSLWMFFGRNTNNLTYVTGAYSASINNPLSWLYVGDISASIRQGNILINGNQLFIYTGTEDSASVSIATDRLYTASISQPLSWSNFQSTVNIPRLQNCTNNLLTVGNISYIFGGEFTGSLNAVLSNKIYSISASSPLTMSDTGKRLPYFPVDAASLVITSSNGLVRSVIIYGGGDNQGTDFSRITSGSITSSLITSNFDSSSNFIFDFPYQTLLNAPITSVPSPITASWAINSTFSQVSTTASYASYASFLNGPATGSVFGTASWANISLSASFADSAPSASFASSSVSSSILSGSWAFLNNQLVIPKFNTIDSTAKVGSLDLWPFALNNCWIGENLSLAGGNFVYKTSGSATLVYIKSPDFMIGCYPPNASGSSTGATTVFKANGSQQNVAIGGTMDTTQQSYVGATLLATGTGKVGINRISPVAILDVNGDISCSVITASLHLGTASFSNTASIALTASISNTASYVASVFVDNVANINYVWDFIAVATSSISIEGWHLNTGSVVLGYTEPNHPGILQLSESNVLNQVNTFTPMGIPSQPSQSIALNDFSNATFIIKPSTGSVGYTFRMGVFDSIRTDTPIHGIYFEKSGSAAGLVNNISTPWMCVVRSASVQLSASSAVSATSSNVWSRFMITYNPAANGTASFYINGLSVATLTASLTGSTGLVYGIQAVPKDGTRYGVLVDYADLKCTATR